MKETKKSVLLFGASGTIGRATARALVAAGHDVTCVLRPQSDTTGQAEGATLWVGEINDAPFAGMDAVVSCLASRTGAPRDAWAVDHDAQQLILRSAKAAGIGQFILLSAICVQKPLLEFQKAKRAFEETLQASGLTYSIVRPTAFFKSLSGQVARLQAGKAFVMFGDGMLTACKPISDRDLGQYITLCLNDPALQNRVLPIGGPGAAMTPRAQGKMIFDLLGKAPKFRSMPVWAMKAIISVLTMLGSISPKLRAKADLAKIGHYYGTESMLVWDGARYDAEATPSFGTDTLEDHYRALIKGEVAAELGDHAVF